MAVVFVDGAPQCGRIDVAALRQLFGRLGALQIAVGQPAVHREGKRLDRAEAVAADEGMVAQQPGTHGTGCWRGGEQVADEVVIRRAFVGKPFAVGQHGDQAGFAALDQVGEAAEAAVFARNQRNGRPSAGRGHVFAHRRAGLFGHAQAVAAVGFGRGAVVRCAVLQRLHPLLQAGFVVRETAAGQYHAARCADIQTGIRRVEQRADDASFAVLP